MAYISHTLIIMKIYPNKTKILVHPKTTTFETDNERVKFLSNNAF